MRSSPRVLARGRPEFGNVNVMAVAHGLDKDLLLKHKAAIDTHLDSIGIPVSYTNVFWGGRSEIKPSEISPIEYQRWCKTMGSTRNSCGRERRSHEDVLAASCRLSGITHPRLRRDRVPRLAEAESCPGLIYPH